MYSNFSLFYSSLFHDRAGGGKRDGCLQLSDTIDFMIPKWRMAQSLDKTSPESGGMDVEQSSYSLHMDIHKDRTKRGKHMQGGKNQESSMQRNQEGKASKRPLVLKLGHQRPPEDYFQSLVEVEWALRDERQSTMPSRGVEDMSMPGCIGERAREEEVMQSIQEGCVGVWEDSGNGWVKSPW